MTYLTCQRCGFSMLSRNPLTDPEFCPRCLAHVRIARQLTRSPAPAGRTGDAGSLDAPAAAPPGRDNRGA
jgi:hypothetical protein